MRDVKLKYHFREIEKMKTHPKVQRRIKSDAEQVARRARQLAPKDSAGGAESIHAEEGRNGSWLVGADALHYYMDFQELGTGAFPPQPFLRPALDGLQTFIHEYFHGF